eukprot:TRINITY_DN8231_c0_g4_i1.p1 TRINITY_DN8231_c0_g4~~TRINITY_DN8231_c0_g4_i1.p1  ORF type:complete len:105 (+),score=0.89 TRINITY_DN8231_c0_g4_i1:354-668(+)
MQWRILINAPECSPLEKEKEKKKGLILLNGPILYRMVFRAIHHVEKHQPPMYRTIWVPRKGGAPYDATDGCPKCNDGVNSDSDRIGLCVPGPSGVHILAEFPVP